MKTFLYIIIFSPSLLMAQITPCVNPMPPNPGTGFGITNVSFNTLNHSTPHEEGFSLEYDSLASITDLGVCESYNLVVTTPGLGAMPDVVEAWIDWNEDGDFFDIGEFYHLTLNGLIASVPITIPYTTTLGNKIMRVTAVKKGLGPIANRNPCTAPFLGGDIEDYKINIVENNMQVDSINIEQTSECYRQNDMCKTVLKMAIYTSGTGNPITVTGFDLNTNGSSNATNDILNASVIYTADTGSFFVCNSPFGNTSAPNGNFVINGSQALMSNSCNNVHYFWLTYDINPGATSGNNIDAQCVNISVNQQGTLSVINPATTSPQGNGSINTFAEICNNGIDDDCDGLVDCYDPDCYGVGICLSESGSFYYGLPSAACPIMSQTIDTAVGLNIDWSLDLGSNNIGIANAPLTGDLDGDGTAEIIVQTSFSPNREITVLNGQTGLVLQTINFTSAPTNNLFTGLIADVDNNSCANIIWKSNNNALKSYDYCSSTFIWTSLPTINPMGSQINIADFNGDGVPEIFDYMHIWNAQTGALLGFNTQNIPPFTTTNYPAIIAADVLPDNYCSTCSGLELVYGHKIFTVDINAGVATFNNIINSELEQYGLWNETKSSASDLDGDGYLDIASTSESLFFTWNPRTGILIDSVSIASLTSINVGSQNRKSVFPIINDIDNDGNMEYIFGTIPTAASNLPAIMFAIDENLNYLWHIIDIHLEPSVLPVIFDLEGDGLKEIIIRAQRNFSSGDGWMYVIDAISGLKKDSLYIAHGTSVAGADGGVVIADVDGDDMVEIIVTGELSSNGPMELAVISSNTNKWACGRQVWNQLNYHPSLINDDLTVPIQPQNTALLPRKEYNGNSIQASYKDVNGNYACPLPDVVVSIDSIDVICDSITVYAEICNIGEGSISGGLCNPSTYISIYNGDPTTTGVVIQTDSLPCNLDTANSCIFYNQTIYTGGQFFNIFIVVNDSANNSTYVPYIHYAECDTSNNMDSLSWLATDSAAISNDTSILCPGNIVNLLATGGNTYLWSPATGLSNANIANPIATALSSTLYSVYVDNGCYIDTLDVLISVNGNLSTNTLTLTECSGFSITINGNTYSSSGVYSDTIFGANSYGCDSIITTDLTIIQIPNAGNDDSISLCTADASIDLFSLLIGADAGGLWSPSISSGTGLFNPAIDSSNNYYYIINNPPCPTDSSLISVIVSDNPSVEITSIDDNCNSALGSISLNTIYGVPPIAYYWNTGEIDSIISNLIMGTYTVTITDSTSCTTTHSILINDSEINCDTYIYIPNVFSPNDDGYNDVLFVRGSSIKGFNLRIYNRWGEVVFESTDITIGWDGTQKGKALNSGVFVYQLIYTDWQNIKQNKSGNVTLIK